jgi:predicted DNA-binding transcriptional regulator AlpA
MLRDDLSHLSAGFLPKSRALHPAERLHRSSTRSIVRALACLLMKVHDVIKPRNKPTRAPRSRKPRARKPKANGDSTPEKKTRPRPPIDPDPARWPLLIDVRHVAHVYGIALRTVWEFEAAHKIPAKRKLGAQANSTVRWSRDEVLKHAAEVKQ